MTEKVLDEIKKAEAKAKKIKENTRESAARILREAEEKREAIIKKAKEEGEKEAESLKKKMDEETGKEIEGLKKKYKKERERIKKESLARIEKATNLVIQEFIKSTSN
jgi:vacuolar-type H+-ATPase subunit H